MTRISDGVRTVPESPRSPVSPSGPPPGEEYPDRMKPRNNHLRPGGPQVQMDLVGFSPHLPLHRAVQDTTS